MDLKSFSHGYGQCAFHIVLVPKYRHRVFVDVAIKSCCEKALREIADRKGCQVYALQVGSDHVHIFVGLRPDCSVSELIGLFKCNSARLLFLEHPELRRVLWKSIFGLVANSIDQSGKLTLKQSNATLNNLSISNFQDTPPLRVG